MGTPTLSNWLGILALPAVVSCGGILGFHDAVANGACGGPLDCAPDESCADGTCAPRCNSDADCSSGRVCRPPANGEPEACVLSGSVPLDGGDDGDAGCPTGFTDCDGQETNGCETNLSFDPNNCGACNSVCDNAPCAAGTCRSPADVGYDEQGSLFLALVPGVIYAWHVTPVPHAGWLWKIGILVSSSTPGVPLHLGVYRDDGAGHPGSLVAQAPLVSGMGSAGPTGNANEVLVPAPLPMLQPEVPYYVAVVTDTNDAGLSPVVTANDGPTAVVFETNYPGADALPPQVTLPQASMSSQANVYIVVAE